MLKVASTEAAPSLAPAAVSASVCLFWRMSSSTSTAVCLTGRLRSFGASCMLYCIRPHIIRRIITPLDADLYAYVNVALKSSISGIITWLHVGTAIIAMDKAGWWWRVVVAVGGILRKKSCTRRYHLSTSLCRGGLGNHCGTLPHFHPCSQRIKFHPEARTFFLAGLAAHSCRVESA